MWIPNSGAHEAVLGWFVSLSILTSTLLPIPSSRIALFVTPDECSIVHTICVCSVPIRPWRLGLLAWGVGPAVTTSALSKCFVHVLLASPLERYPGFQGHRVILHLVPKN